MTQAERLQAIRARYLGRQPNAAHDVVADIVFLLGELNELLPDASRLAQFLDEEGSITQILKRATAEAQPMRAREALLCVELTCGRCCRGYRAEVNRGGCYIEWTAGPIPETVVAEAVASTLKHARENGWGDDGPICPKCVADLNRPICTTCGRRADDGWGFCPNCGGAIAWPEEQP